MDDVGSPKAVDLIATARPGAEAEPVTVPVVIESRGGELAGDLTVPAQPAGIVVFAHGSGSSRHSRRNRAVAKVLQRSGVATLLLDLLTAEEEQLGIRTGHLRFDIGLLAGRVTTAVEQIREHAVVEGLPVGLFGASTGAAAALVAAAHDHSIRAVVSRGGRPDLAGAALHNVQAPTLLIVGSLDERVLDLNRQAGRQLAAENRIEVVEGASHLFEKPGALEEVARLAAGWFHDHLAS
jgi:dienelactone hydrolase